MRRFLDAGAERSRRDGDTVWLVKGIGIVFGLANPARLPAERVPPPRTARSGDAGYAEKRERARVAKPA